MRTPFALATLALALAASGPALADDTIITGISEGVPEPAYKTSSLSFIYSDCEEECVVAILSCNENRTIGFTYPDVPSEELAAALMAERQEIELTVGGKSFGFDLAEMQFAELTVAWWVDGPLRPGDDPLALLDALKAAKSFDVKLQKLHLNLPVTPDMKTWADACAK